MWQSQLLLLNTFETIEYVCIRYMPTYMCYVGIKDRKERDRENESHKFSMLACTADDCFFFKGIYS